MGYIIKFQTITEQDRKLSNKSYFQNCSMYNGK